MDSCGTARRSIVFKMLSFGFDRYIKTNSQLVSRLISNTLLDASIRRTTPLPGLP